MNAEIKTQWVNALRSGEYKQGRHALRNLNADGTSGNYCCLGVLCDLHSKATGQTWDGNKYLGTNEVVPLAVKEWAGFEEKEAIIATGLNASKTDYGIYARPIDEDGHESCILLSDANDCGRSFEYIAGAIERGIK